MKKILIFLLTFISLILLVACNKASGTINTKSGVIYNIGDIKPDYLEYLEFSEEVEITEIDDSDVDYDEFGSYTILITYLNGNVEGTINLIITVGDTSAPALLSSLEMDYPLSTPLDIIEEGFIIEDNYYSIYVIEVDWGEININEPGTYLVEVTTRDYLENEETYDIYITMKSDSSPIILGQNYFNIDVDGELPDVYNNLTVMGEDAPTFSTDGVIDLTTEGIKSNRIYVEDSTGKSNLIWAFYLVGDYTDYLNRYDFNYFDPSVEETKIIEDYALMATVATLSTGGNIRPINAPMYDSILSIRQFERGLRKKLADSEIEVIESYRELQIKNEQSKLEMVFDRSLTAEENGYIETIYNFLYEVNYYKSSVEGTIYNANYNDLNDLSEYYLSRTIGREITSDEIRALDFISALYPKNIDYYNEILYENIMNVALRTSYTITDPFDYTSDNNSIVEFVGSDFGVDYTTEFFERTLARELTLDEIDQVARYNEYQFYLMLIDFVDNYSDSRIYDVRSLEDGFRVILNEFINQAPEYPFDYFIEMNLNAINDGNSLLPIEVENALLNIIGEINTADIEVYLQWFEMYYEDDVIATSQTTVLKNLLSNGRLTIDNLIEMNKIDIEYLLGRTLTSEEETAILFLYDNLFLLLEYNETFKYYDDSSIDTMNFYYVNQYKYYPLFRQGYLNIASFEEEYGITVSEEMISCRKEYIALTLTSQLFSTNNIPLNQETYDLVYDIAYSINNENMFERIMNGIINFGYPVETIVTWSGINLDSIQRQKLKSFIDIIDSNYNFVYLNLNGYTGLTNEKLLYEAHLHLYDLLGRNYIIRYQEKYENATDGLILSDEIQAGQYHSIINKNINRNIIFDIIEENSINIDLDSLDLDKVIEYIQFVRDTTGGYYYVTDFEVDNELSHWLQRAVNSEEKELINYTFENLYKSKFYSALGESFELNKMHSNETDFTILDRLVELMIENRNSIGGNLDYFSYYSILDGYINLSLDDINLINTLKTSKTEKELEELVNKIFIYVDENDYTTEELETFKGIIREVWANSYYQEKYLNSRSYYSLVELRRHETFDTLGLSDILLYDKISDEFIVKTLSFTLESYRGAYGLYDIYLEGKSLYELYCNGCDLNTLSEVTDEEINYMKVYVDIMDYAETIEGFITEGPLTIDSIVLYYEYSNVLSKMYIDYSYYLHIYDYTYFASRFSYSLSPEEINLFNELMNTVIYPQAASDVVMMIELLGGTLYTQEDIEALMIKVNNLISINSLILLSIEDYQMLMTDNTITLTILEEQMLKDFLELGVNYSGAEYYNNTLIKDADITSYNDFKLWFLTNFAMLPQDDVYIITELEEGLSRTLTVDEIYDLDIYNYYQAAEKLSSIIDLQALTTLDVFNSLEKDMVYDLVGLYIELVTNDVTLEEIFNATTPISLIGRILTPEEEEYLEILYN